MTSLYPGMLFYSTGLNRKSTPVKPETTPSEIERRLGRAPFNGRPWPKSSPVSAVYDVRNSSTRMIILNNKLSKKPKGSHLRGQSDYVGEISQPEPERHISDTPHTNWQHHKQCSVSASEKFVPIYPSGVSPLPEWVNKTQRPPMKFDNGSGVNPNHHIQCQGHMDYDIVRWYNAHRRPRSRTSSRGTSHRALSPILNDPSLSRGEKRYLSHIAKIYSVDDMRQQKQIQYNALMWKEINKGSYKESDWGKYNRYLNTPRKTQFGPCDPFRHNKRSISAPGSRKDSKGADDGDESRPYTTRTDPRPQRSSRGSTMSRPIGRRAGNRQAVSQPMMRTKSGKGVRSSQTKSHDLTGQPARVESPLPLKPKSPASSMSSLAEEREGDKERPVNDNKKQTEKADKVKSPREKQTAEEKDEKEKVAGKDDQAKERADVKIAVDEAEDKRMSDEDDERSKMSARDTARSGDEQRGTAVEYRPTYGDRSGEDERSQAEDSPKASPETYQYKDQPRAQQEEDVPVQKAEEKEAEEEVVRLKKEPEPKENTEEDKDQAGISSDEGPELIHHIHKEGKDRPLSRLGGREQFMVVKKQTERENSDDDYSDDDEEEPRSSDRSKQRSDEMTDRTQSDERRDIQEPTVTAATPAKDERASEQDENAEDSDLKLGVLKDDGTSVISSRSVLESSNQSKYTAYDQMTITEASTRERGGDTSTLDY